MGWLLARYSPATRPLLARYSPATRPLLARYSPATHRLLINYVKFSAIYVLTTSPLVSDNRVLVRKIGRRVAGE